MKEKDLEKLRALMAELAQEKDGALHLLKLAAQVCFPDEDSDQKDGQEPTPVSKAAAHSKTENAGGEGEAGDESKSDDSVLWDPIAAINSMFPVDPFRDDIDSTSMQGITPSKGSRTKTKASKKAASSTPQTKDKKVDHMTTTTTPYRKKSTTEYLQAIDRIGADKTF